MYSIKQIIRINKLSVSILLFLVLLLGVHMYKPGFIYTPEGGFRQFGLGFRNKTIFPIWVVSIILAILSYLAILYYLAFF